MKSLIIISTITLFVSSAQAKYGGGTGEPNDPYLIYTAEHLNAIGVEPNDWDKHFKLMEDINLSHYAPDDFNIIGVAWNNIFTGVFDGNGRTIRNFTHHQNGQRHAGLFGWVDDPNAEIRNIGLIDPNVQNGPGVHSTGSLVGFLWRGTLRNCYVIGGRAAGYESVGILAGYNNGHIIECYSEGTAVGTLVVGGLVGSNHGHIVNSYSIGEVLGDCDVGGLAGYNAGIISDCYSAGPVDGNDNVGGFLGRSMGSGRNFGSVERGCFWNMATSGRRISAGATGKTTAEMQMASTFLDAGWDFVEETASGTDDIWWILEGQSYPRLWWQYGLAFSPYPQDGVVDVPQPLILSWLPGGLGLYHDIYFGENKEAVANATIESQEIYRGRQEPGITNYDLGNLNLDETYYWRIDEVDEADPNNPGKGDVWSFTTANFIIVDDFEDYNSYPSENRIWRSWKDGLGYGQPDTSPDYHGNGTGSVVGDDTTPSYTEEAIVRSGLQSMPYLYDNNKPGYFKYSEAEKTLSYPRNWTDGDFTELSLWFRGSLLNDSELMYVAITNKASEPAVIYYDDPNAVRIDTWTEWIIPLQQFVDQGIDLSDVDRIAIGFGTRGNLTVPGGQGKMYFDDIRIYNRSVKL
jgi:hypothetical protein